MSADREPSSLDWLHRTHSAEEFRALVRGRVVRRRRVRRSATAAVAIAAIICVVLWRGGPEPVATETPRARLAVVMPERHTLPDGSVVELKAGAKFAVRYEEAQRRVVLEEGEAHFTVAPNPVRPFVVSARGISVRAVGTAFSVGLSEGDVAVLVTEGRVAVESSVQETPTLGFLDAGNRAVIGFSAMPAMAAAPVEEAELSLLFGWRAPRLDLDGTPLRDVVATINEHSATKLVLGDDQVGALLLSGILRADNLEPLLRMIEASYPVRVERREQHVTLRRR